MVICYQNFSDLVQEKYVLTDWEIFLKFKGEGWDFAKLLRSLEQFIQTVQWKVRTMFGNRMFF